MIVFVLNAGSSSQENSQATIIDDEVEKAIFNTK